MLQTKFVEEIKIHILCSVTLFENCAVYEIMWKKYCRAGQTAGQNGACASRVGYLWLQMHKLRLC